MSNAKALEMHRAKSATTRDGRVIEKPEPPEMEVWLRGGWTYRQVEDEEEAGHGTRVRPSKA